jgi:hypothetical protein
VRATNDASLVCGIFGLKSSGRWSATQDGIRRVQLNHPSSIKRAWEKVNVIPEPKPEREKKANITAAEHEALIAERDELKEKIENAEWNAQPEDIEALRGKLQIVEEENARLRERIAELEAKPTKSAKPTKEKRS